MVKQDEVQPVGSGGAHQCFPVNCIMLPRKITIITGSSSGASRA
jgi:hypothetical protein